MRFRCKAVVCIERNPFTGQESDTKILRVHVSLTRDRHHQLLNRINNYSSVHFKMFAMKTS